MVEPSRPVSLLILKKIMSQKSRLDMEMGVGVWLCGVGLAAAGGVLS
jgi:hypothetical protein